MIVWVCLKMCVSVSFALTAFTSVLTLELIDTQKIGWPLSGPIIVLSNMIRQENVRGTPRSNPVGITAVGQDFFIQYLIWPNLENNLKEKNV